MNIIKSVFLTLIILFTFSSCATIFSGTKDLISFKSNPSGAKVFIDGIEICKTPCEYKVKRSLNDKSATIKLDGYETKVFELSRQFNPVAILNLGDLVGWGVDAATGALMKYDTKAYDFNLEKKGKKITKIEIDTVHKKANFYVLQK